MTIFCNKMLLPWLSFTAKKTFLESGCSAGDAVEPTAKWQAEEQSMLGVGGLGEGPMGPMG